MMAQLFKVLPPGLLLNILISYFNISIFCPLILVALPFDSLQLPDTLVWYPGAGQPGQLQI